MCIIIFKILDRTLNLHYFCRLRTTEGCAENESAAERNVQDDVGGPREAT